MRVVMHGHVSARVDRRLEARAVFARQRIARRQQHDVAGRHGLQQWPHLRAKKETAARLDHVERLDAERIAGREKLSVGQIDGDKGIHPDEALESPVAPHLQGIRQDFGVGLGPEFNTEVGELLPQFKIVVDFAVEGDRKTRIERNLRLDAVLGIDDPQPARTHGSIFAKHCNGVGDVTAM